MLIGRGRRSGRARFGVRASLVVLVLPPLVGTSVFAWEAARPKLEAAQLSEEIRDGAERVGALTQVRYLVPVERILTLALTRTAEIGLTVDQTTELFGIDMAAELSVTRAAADLAMGKLADTPDAPAMPTLARVRRLVDSETLGAAGVVELYSDVEEEVQRVLSTEVSALDREVASAGAGSAMYEATEMLPVVVDAVDAALGQVVELGLGLMSTGAQQRGHDVALVRETAGYDRAAALLDANLTGTVRRVWDEYRSSAALRAFDTAVVAASSRAAGTSADPVDATEVYRLSYVRSAALLEVMDAAVVRVRVAAASLRRSARADAARMTIVLAVLIGATATFVLVNARALGRSLQRMGSCARRIIDGDLDDVAVDEAGPRELAMVSRALNELVVELRRVERQARALATGSVSDSVLAERAPGGLGDALQDAVAMLATSIAEREALQGRLEHEASHDSLTGLVNRAAAIEELERALARAARNNSAVAVLFCDLDGFKVVNDTRGHAAGDVVLVEVAERLRATVRAGDVVARLGGDELVVIAESVDSLAEMVALGERIVAAVSVPVDVGPVPVSVGVSVGVALGDARLTADELLVAADTAVYAAKARGRSRVEVTEPLPAVAEVRSA